MTRHIVMAGLVPAINVLDKHEDVDARQRAGHDGGEAVRLA